jgi:hypothetical protein
MSDDYLIMQLIIRPLMELIIRPYCLGNRTNYFETFLLVQVTGGLEYVLPIMSAVMLAKWVGDVVGELQCVCMRA